MKKLMFLLLLLLFVSCAEKAKPVATVTVEPMGQLPNYTWIDAPDGGVCLSAKDKAPFNTEQELLLARIKYLTQKLKDMGAVFLPKPVDAKSGGRH